MKRLLAILLVAATCWAHVAGRKDLKPSKAAADLKKARAKMNAAKHHLAARGKYACCMKQGSCDLCVRRHGSCACAANLAKGAGVCGQCQADWQAKGKTYPLLASDKQIWGRTAELTPELEEAKQMLLDAKRVLVSEKRYSCCVRGGCDECAYEGDCPCGSELAKPASESKGICGSCLDGWHAGEGAFPGIARSELKLAPMEAGMMSEGAMAGMSPNVAQAGWYTSGTSQTPRDSPMFMIDRAAAGGWTIMAMGQAYLLYTGQSSPRGGDKFFATNWIMPMATRSLGRGQLTLRSMFSLEPATVTSGRYPLLFQSGETYQRRPIIDGQHPHSFLMELGAAYSLPVARSTSLNFYGGARGEPAIGPGAYAHRLSQSENPLAVLAHHYQDSTHIAGNVVTAGITHRAITIEGSGFLGREPGESRWTLERGGIDSWSTRLTVTPTSRIATQFSYASLNAPESNEPDSKATRMSGSVTYVRPHAYGGHWASTILWGRNHKLGHHDEPGARFNSYLAESTLRWQRKNWAWTRFELTDKDARLAGREDESPIGRVKAITLGYSRELPISTSWLGFALGGQVSSYWTPPALRPFYGDHPVGAQIFLRMRLRTEASR